MPDQDARQRRAGERIAVPWRVSRIRLLGALELDVVDDAGTAQHEVRPGSEAPQPQRELAIAAVRGFGPMAKAAFVALVLNLKTGRTAAQLGEAMEGSPNPPLALQTHLSAVRRTGLRISYKAGIYRVDDLERSQVDALQFGDIYKRLKALSAANGTQDNILAVIEGAEEAVQLWGGDLLAAHPYFADRLVLRNFTDWHADIQRWQAKALLARGEDVDIADAAKLIEQIETRDPRHPEVQHLRDSLTLSLSPSSDRPIAPHAASTEPPSSDSRQGRQGGRGGQGEVPVESLAAILKAKYSLRDVVTVEGAWGDALYDNLGVGGARYFRDHVERNFRVAFSCANTIHNMVRHVEPFRLAMDAYPISFNVVPELTSVMSSYAALIELWQRNPECRAHAVNFPSFFTSEAERAAFENRPDVRALVEQVRDVNMAFYSCGSFGPGSSYGVVKEYVNRFIDREFDPRQLQEAGACGEINWHPYSLGGETIYHPVTYSFGFIDLATLRDLSRRRDRYMILVAGGPQKVEPIVGALHGGFLNVLITDELTLRAVTQLDEASSD